MATLTARANAMPPTPLPGDVLLMNRVATALFALFAAGLVAAGTLWLWRSPWLPIRAVQVEGEVARNSAGTLRAAVLPRLQGNFFSLDLQGVRAALHQVPWVRQAEVRRIWPDTLRLRLEEHQVVALWESEDGNERLVNVQGEVFDANTGDVEDDDLPTFGGPDGASAQVLAMHRALTPVVQGMQAQVDGLSLSGRGSWRMELDTGATIELGRGSEEEVVARLQRFVRTLPQLQQRYPAPLESADLRYAQGYAVKLRGITTEAQKPEKK